MFPQLRSLAAAYLPTTETLGRVATGATALLLLWPAYDATKATIKAASDAGISCLPNPTFVWNIVHPILKWKTVFDTSHVVDSCVPKLFATTEIAAFAISATLLSLYLAKNCRKTAAPVDFMLTPRTLASVNDQNGTRATLVRKEQTSKPLPTLPSEERPPAPPSGNYGAFADAMKKGTDALAGCTIS